MIGRIFVIGFSASLLSTAAFAIGPATNGAVTGSSSSTSTTAPSCDGCSSTDNSGDTDTNQNGSTQTGPITNPTTPKPAHTNTPSHVPQPPGGGGAPKD